MSRFTRFLPEIQVQIWKENNSLIDLGLLLLNDLKMPRRIYYKDEAKISNRKSINNRKVRWPISSNVIERSVRCHDNEAILIKDHHLGGRLTEHLFLFDHFFLPPPSFTNAAIITTANPTIIIPPTTSFFNLQLPFLSFSASRIKILLQSTPNYLSLNFTQFLK